MNRQPKLFALGVLALALLLLLTMPLPAKEIKGMLTTVDPDNRSFTLTDDNGDHLGLRLMPSGKVLVNDEESDLSDLLPGEQLSVTVENDKDQMVATVIRCNRE